jgi:hypothetical protein
MRWPNTSNCWPILNIQMMCSQDEFAWAKSQQINDRWFYHSRDAEQMKLFLEQRECSSIEASNGQFLKRIRCNVGRRWQLSTKRKVSTRVLRTLGLSRFEETCCTELRNNRHIRQTTKKKIVSRQIGKEKLHTSKESCVMVKLTKNLCWKKLNWASNRVVNVHRGTSQPLHWSAVTFLSKSTGVARECWQAKTSKQNNGDLVFEEIHGL